MSAVGAVMVLRAGYGLTQLAAPQWLAGQVIGQRLDERGLLAARILGARHLAQVGLTAPAPTATVLGLGVDVDLLHAASMIALALAWPSRRRAALSDAAVALAFATAGALAATRTPHRTPRRQNHGRLVQLRDRCAARVQSAAVRAGSVRRGAAAEWG